MTRRIATIAVMALCWACSTSTEGITTPETVDGLSPLDINSEVRGEFHLPDVPLDQRLAEITLDLNAFEVPAPDLEPACESGSGCFLDPCNDPADCLSGLCVGHMGDLVCTITCVEECPTGWQCQQMGTGPDAMFACLSPFSYLCRPCKNADDCKEAGGQEHACISYGEAGSFCGAPCGDSCPWGFSCKQVSTVDSVELEQCVNDTGSCPCTQTSVELGLWTPCTVTNDAGTCNGKRVCTVDGLSPCNAATPGTETCNGLDDDCDGNTDEPDLLDGEYVELCNDHNPCTQDSCPGEQGCVNQILDAASCDDGDPCTAADHCEQGTCLGEQVLCDDSNPCTDDVCTPMGGCDHPFGNQGCDDNDVCTVGDVCVEGECHGASASCDCKTNQDCIALEDGDLCNGTLMCDTQQFPFKCMVDPETLVTCPEPEGDNAFCLQPLCNPADGQCSLVPANQDYLCTNGDKCTTGNRCQDGVCTDGTPVNCNDGNLCTDDSCQTDVGCVHIANQADCNDADVCTTQDQCADSFCMGGPSLICDDNNSCNGVESCSPDTGCLPGTPLSCDDGNLCNGHENCLPESGCLPGQPLECDDGNPCTDDSCTPDTGCEHAHNQASCNDGNLCTKDDSCIQGQCTPGNPVNCDDQDICTDDWCIPATGCGHSFNQAPCTDDSVCTLKDHCEQGTCVSNGTLSCDDDNPCTDDSCHPEAGCLHTPNQATCDDGNQCTAGDHCQDGKCKIAGPVACNDENICTDDWCDPATGCQTTANENLCNDDDACTLKDRCKNSQCLGDTLLECDDGNPCTDDGCEPATGCVNQPNQESCDDGDPCTEKDICDNAQCQAGAAVVCDDDNECTDDSCLAMAGCQFEKLTSTPCDNSDLCTVDDTCDDGQCVPGPALDCNDDNVCTDDSCAPETGCGNIPNQATCDDGDPCTGQDTCADGQCVPGDGPGCDDSDPCTSDTCQPDGSCLHQSDLSQVGCSDWSVEPAVSCIIGYPPSMDENGVVWTLATTTSCSGSDAYNNDAIVGINSTTGDLISQFTVASPNSQPIYRESRITMSTDWNWNSTCGGCQIAYDLPGGSQAWKGGQGPHARGGISMNAQGTIFSANNSILAIGWSGSNLWSTSGNGGLGAGSIILADGHVVGCGTSGSCRKVTQSGSSVWQLSMGCGGSSLASDSAARLIAACGNVGVRAVNPDSSTAWTVSPDPNVNGPLVWSDDRIIVGTGEGKALVLSPADGAVVLSLQLCTDAQFTPWLLTSDDWVWGTCSDGHASGASLTSDEAWSVATAESPRWLTLAADGNLLLAVGKTVWRLTRKTPGLAQTPWPTRDHDLTRSRNGEL